MRSLFWHRRDLRIHDNAGLYEALKNSSEVIPVFIFDTKILQSLPNNDRRVQFIYEKCVELKSLYNKHNSDLLIEFGDPKEVIIDLVKKLHVQALFFNKDYEPYAIDRDRYVYNALQKINVSVKAKKDHVIFEKNEILKQDGKPYTVFTPYSKKWLEKLSKFYLSSYPVEKYTNNLANLNRSDFPSLESLGFDAFPENVNYPNSISKNTLKDYSEKRDFPSLNGTSKLSIHLRFGTISVRELARDSISFPTYLNELIWRDFYQMIIYHFPYSAANSFKPQYDRIEWETNEEQFQKWCEGKTGYPLVDAGMRELNQTGFMHNRVRMVVASFLCKHLLIDWRLGERYFAEKLIDFELASNCGGWQWAAGSGCDAAPYFRVFNPQTQQEKFDPNFEYIKKWVPEWGTPTYPKPIVEHKFARERAISRFKEALS